MARARKRSGGAAEPVETGAVRKRWHGRTRVVLAYPNTYHVGMSNLGFHSIYRLLNARNDVVCERLFLPAQGHASSPPQTVESRRNVTDADIIAFSLSFENDYVNVLSILKQAGLPLAAEHRGSPHPLVVAGGVACFLNPEPLAPFVDCFLLGEAETNLDAFMDRFDRNRDRRRMLEEMAADVPGTYVPAFYRVDYHPDGTLKRFEPQTRTAPVRVKSPVVADIRTLSTENAITSPDTAFADTRLIEVSRGCPHGCRFCSAGFVYRPPRMRSEQFLNACIADEDAAHPKTVGLVGTAVSDLPFLDRLCETARQQGIRISLSSMRADALNPSLVASMAAGGVKTATVAPDAGSRRMRSVINKGITEAQILDATDMLVAGGIPNIKLYFMVGLPTEQDADVDAVVFLCRRIKERFLEASRPTGRIGTLSVSINAFVPKPFTPFQWCAMDLPGSLKKKTDAVRARLKSVANLRIRVENIRTSRIQALLSRGDRRVGGLLHQVVSGTPWTAVFKTASDQIAFYTTRERDLDERLPWDFIDHGIRPAFLKREYRRAMAGKPSPPCPVEPCSRCGICRSTVETGTP